jgi:hypothetical protein
VETQNNTGRPDGSRATSLPEIFGAARSKASRRAANGQRTGLGCMIQYVLRTSTFLDPTVLVSGLNTAPDSATECDAGLVVEAIQKWNICQKQNRREREDNIDIYGEKGNSDNNKIYPKEVKKGNSIHPEAGGTFMKAKINLEEKHHLYISETELQMHQARTPLWAKPGVCCDMICNIFSIISYDMICK